MKLICQEHILHTYINPQDYLTLERVSLLVKLHEYKASLTVFMGMDDSAREHMHNSAALLSTEAALEWNAVSTAKGQLHRVLVQRKMPSSDEERRALAYYRNLTRINESLSHNTIAFNRICALGRQFNPEYSLTKKQGVALKQILESYKKTKNCTEVESLIYLAYFLYQFFSLQISPKTDAFVALLLLRDSLIKNGFEICYYNSLELYMKQRDPKLFSAEVTFEEFLDFLLNSLLCAHRVFEEQMITMNLEGLSKPERIRKTIRNNSNPVSKTELLSQCPGISQVTMQRTLKDLTAQGVIRKLGGGRYTLYVWNTKQAGDADK